MKLTKTILEQLVEKELENTLQEEPRTLVPAKADIRADDLEAERAPYPGDGPESGSSHLTGLTATQLAVGHGFGGASMSGGVDLTKLSDAQKAAVWKSQMSTKQESLQRIVHEELATILAESHDSEGDMAQKQLLKINEYSNMLMDLVADKRDLPEWVQSKLAIIGDDIGEVYHHMHSEETLHEEVIEER